MDYIGYETIPLLGIIFFSLISFVAFLYAFYYWWDPRDEDQDNFEESSIKWLWPKRFTTSAGFIGFLVGACFVAGQNNWGYSKPKGAA